MKKVLIITYYWPPSAGSGVQRWLKFAKYLPSQGWQPHIYTPENPDFDLRDEGLLEDVSKDCIVVKRRIWEPYALAKFISRDKKINVGVVGDGPKKDSKFKKVLNWLRGNFFIPDPRVFWVRPSVKFLKNYIKENNITHIITTGPPHSMHLIGLGLKKRLNVKWIVDIRDPWSKLDFLDTFYVSKKSRKKYEKMESEVLNLCDKVIATSPSMPSQLMKFDSTKFKSITNGYDLEDFNAKDGEQDGYITIYHAGLLNKIRNPKNLWKALNSICETNPEIDQRLKIHLAGVIDPGVINSIMENEHLKSKLKVEGYKKHEDVIKDYMNSEILLLLINNTENAKVNIPGKLFEYIASQKKILAIGDIHSDAGQIIANERLGVCFPYNIKIDQSSFEEFLKSNKTVNKVPGYKHSRRSLTASLIETLESI